MSELSEIIKAYKPEKFVSLTIPVEKIQAALPLTYSEANVVMVLLREYKAHESEFGVKALRQHMVTVRRKLAYILGNEMIENNGLGFYSINDDNKEIIADYINNNTAKVATNG